VESSGELANNLVDASGAYDLAELIDVVYAARCVVSVNTGIVHLAAATGVPTVALNGPTAGKRWGPVGERAASVESPYSGCGYLHFGWEYGGQREDCMKGIRVDRVLRVVTEAIGDRSATA
jgi:heptosyltransferase I